MNSYLRILLVDFYYWSDKSSYLFANQCKLSHIFSNLSQRSFLSTGILIFNPVYWDRNGQVLAFRLRFWVRHLRSVFAFLFQMYKREEILLMAILVEWCPDASIFQLEILSPLGRHAWGLHAATLRMIVPNQAFTFSWECWHS